MQGQDIRVRRRIRITIAAWITILILTGAFQLYRGDAITDGVVFLAMAAALIVGETGVLSRLDGKLLKPRRLVVAIALAVDAGTLVFTPRHGMFDGIVIAVTGVLVFLVAWPNGPVSNEGPEPWTPRMSRAAIAWAILGLAFVLWELAMYFLGYGQDGRTAFPALSDILDPVLNNPIGRFLGTVAWLAGGAALMRRGRRST
ncbi:MAG TPA: hypothetical protein VHZ81_03450 [Galbitalea sp.]|nr:hypothetical protein [Galbitalea sp.]